MDEVMDVRELTGEELEALEALRDEEQDRALEPYRRAAAQRRQSAEIVAEHDEILAELMFNDVMRELEG